MQTIVDNRIDMVKYKKEKYQSKIINSISWNMNMKRLY